MTACRPPERMERSIQYLNRGYQEDREEILQSAMFDVAYDEMVIVKDIECLVCANTTFCRLSARCTSQILRCGKVIGLSKVPRLVDVFARRLPVQERLTTHIAERIESAIKPHGVGVVVEARHLCVMMRGVEKQLFVTKSGDDFLALIHPGYSVL